MAATCPGAAPAPSSPRPSPPAETAPPPEHDAEAMCRYPSKKCWNPRALKRNGERHNLCDFHRQKANKNQRRLELKRKARAQQAPEDSVGKRPRAHKKPRQCVRRAPLSAHVAMKEEARAKQEAAVAAAASSMAEGLTGWFLQDLVLLDGVYDRAVKVEPASVELPGDIVGEETLDRLLQDRKGDCESLDTTSGLEALAALPEGKTSPVDVGESLDSLDFSDYWLPVEQPAVSFDASAFVDDDVFVADV
jgi:hypothetical protein